MINAPLKRLLQGLRADAGLVILTGAGISRESGLHTFRDTDGIWAQVRLEDVATPEAFARNPAQVQGFYNARRRAVLDPAVQPNAAHHALVQLERQWRGPFLLVTQNVDDLHARAGSSRLLPMHGELLKIRCAACGRVDRFEGDLAVSAICPGCGAIGSLRPHIVWFGEMPLFMAEIGDALSDAGLFIAIGTSGTVYPAAGFAAEAKANGATTLEINMAETGGRFDGGLYGPATQTVPALVDFLCKEVQ
ncbi:NAD-dependent protein deacylase [Niveispirillum lacus]|uniref:NAD-dependent protein deacylase n=1 Tax=Niveispirillum lacus TaxID=1981099 RepID=A0A255YRD6_9PROT|nr:NAD-dependent deacylase [Niveispirillum lacus]OYQ31773.1 NAD-dependent protein deacylase [Niveispirillum lacus]